MRDIDEITGIIVDTAYKLHIQLGPGLLESVYEMVMAKELERQGLKVERQKPISIEFDGLFFEEGFRVDLLVDDRVIVELKSVEILAPIHFKKVLTYLKLIDQPVGLLINFGAVKMKEGLHLIVNGYQPSTTNLRVNRKRL